MATPPPAATAAAPGGRRPNPRIAQMRRTFFFLSRNTLAMVGLVIVLFFGVVALFSFFYPAPSEALSLYCGSYPPTLGGNTTGCIPVCTYQTGTPPPQA